MWYHKHMRKQQLARIEALTDFMEDYGMMADGDLVERKEEIMEALFAMSLLGREGSKWEKCIGTWRTEMAKAYRGKVIRWTMLQWNVYAAQAL